MLPSSETKYRARVSRCLIAAAVPMLAPTRPTGFIKPFSSISFRQLHGIISPSAISRSIILSWK